MKVGQQIQVRMEQLGVSAPELAKRVGVSAQAVRHWVAGRSFPGKRHAPALESALSFSLDYTEGTSRKTGRVDASTLMERHDVELMLMISRLEPGMRMALAQLVEACLATQRGAASTFSSREGRHTVEPFFEKGRGAEIGKRSRKRAGGS